MLLIILTNFLRTLNAKQIISQRTKECDPPLKPLKFLSIFLKRPTFFSFKGKNMDLFVDLFLYSALINYSALHLLIKCHLTGFCFL